jgi:hypothetical protein
MSLGRGYHVPLTPSHPLAFWYYLSSRYHLPLPQPAWPCDTTPMPKGPQGQKRPADVIGNAVHVMRIATGEIEDTKRDVGTEANRKGGLKGGKARAKALSPKRRKAIAKKAAMARWTPR